MQISPPQLSRLSLHPATTATMASSRSRNRHLIWNTNQRRDRTAKSVSPQVPRGPFTGSSPDLAARFSASNSAPNHDPIVSTPALSLRLSTDSQPARRQNSLDRSSVSNVSTSPLSLRLSADPDSVMARRAPRQKSLDHGVADTVPLRVRMSGDLEARPAKRPHSIHDGVEESVSTIPLGLRLLDSEALLRPPKKHKSRDRSSVDSLSIAPPVPTLYARTESSIPKSSTIPKSLPTANNPPRPHEPSNKHKFFDLPRKPKPRQRIRTLKSIVPPLTNLT
jgi:hypothetical protein